ncbi:hypothetical protein [Jannaschia pohangensis]|uniref:Uncharacterized protein n=1 Tax=Jannaschia pohangensis TaxID=390807 RepID=A0A1I3QA76_9RHOB|nr:hypothetical protein [Jannaschia pohangensis]SFJ31164.1 hypothetical protein SAMN04488095_2478 [Jannaschia pohangensis]
MRRAIAAALLVLGPSVVSAEEVLRFFPPAGVEGVHASATPGLRLVEYVTEGQNLAFWSQAITVAEMPGSKVSAMEFVDILSADMTLACPAAFRMDPEVTMMEDRSVTMSIHACQNLEPTGRSEVAILRVLEGKEGLYAVQIAWSESPPRDDLLNWSAWLRDVTLCDETGCAEITEVTAPDISPDGAAPTE